MSLIKHDLYKYLLCIDFVSFKFHNPDKAYNDFISRFDCVANAAGPFKTVRVKNNTSERFDGEIADKIHTREKLYKRFMLTK